MKQFTKNIKTLLNILGLRRQKVFAIGFNKTATSSLHTLFNEMGRPSYHGVEWRDLLNTELLKKYDCFSDGPPDDIAKLDQMFPGSKFILQVRDLRSWVHSRLSHIDRYKSIPSYKTNLGWDTTETAIKMWIERRNTYHKLVLEHFRDRPQDLLVVNFIRDENAAVKTCRFLGYRHHCQNPKENVNPIRKLNSKYVRMLENCADEFGLTEAELDYDLFCPSLGIDTTELPLDTTKLDVAYMPI